MTLSEAIESYLAIKRSLGAVFAADARILHSFGRAVGNVPLDSIRRDTCQVFCRGTGRPTRFWERKHYTLRGFFGHLVARSHLPASPLPEAGPRIPHSFQAHIYSHDEMCRLLDATSVLELPEIAGNRAFMTCATPFALRRLIAWYREAADVQACLSLLATYLGHINLSGTQTYLTMTPELLGEALLRFERFVALDRSERIGREKRLSRGGGERRPNPVGMALEGIS